MTFTFHDGRAVVLLPQDDYYEVFFNKKYIGMIWHNPKYFSKKNKGCKDRWLCKKPATARHHPGPMPAQTRKHAAKKLLSLTR